MNIRDIMIGVLAGIFLSAPAFAQTLWENVNRGMSIDEVRAAQPAATPVSKPDSVITGATGNLQLSNYRFGGVPFDVLFFFLDGKLVQINLTAAGKPAHIDYENIVKILRTQHGPETSGGKTAIGYQNKWENVGGLNININYLTELGRRLLIGYGTPG